ncbi:hypothetical protein CF394_06450 [Tetzosporium hominis]|uniref:Flagellar FliJ protein n=1 Tax=Tetzosporium hominis TaxID=2020506 RepID=A0A264W473_9BACL|nr:flagellar FliJ family protein [Tetzosporium hominis]OZS78393.1 hypothetical protein CF394_06450 [Tetzosporium hominis]
MTFHYKYQRILDVREVQKKAVEGELSTIRKRADEVDHETNQIDLTLQELELQKQQQVQQGIRVQQLQQYYQHELYMYQQLQLARFQQDQMNQQVTLAEQKVLEASSETKKWDRLKEKAQQLFHTERTQAEQKIADEMTLLRLGADR